MKIIEEALLTKIVGGGISGDPDRAILPRRVQITPRSEKDKST